ncbi:FAD dependent oxidoreductase [Chiua virens]|nr:FAD dependent oxidoreductase [Chiua virens]
MPIPDHPLESFMTTSRIVIVGAGTFGLSTAFHLLDRGYTDVTILDRASQLPAVDAASTDINKVIRSCYSDAFYTRLAREAMDAWKQPQWQGCYHECGVINVGCEAFDERLRDNDRRLGAHVEDLPDAGSVRGKLVSSLRAASGEPIDTRIGSLVGYRGYFNSEGGWAEAARAVGVLLGRVREMGGRVMGDREVVGLIRDEDGRTTGVVCRDGTSFDADRVVLTVGSWTASTFPELALDARCLATGQSVAMIQLSREEQERYEATHVYLDFDSGLYTFPPTHDGIIKVAIHTAGHTHMVAPRQIDQGPVCKVSTPRTIVSHPHSGDGLRVPRSALDSLRKHLGEVYPELAEKPWSATRMCWYTDSPDGDWVIGPFPGDSTLFLATSGSGHAFKFLPTVGRLVVESLKGTLDAATAARFAVDRDVAGAKNGERASNVTQELDLADLCGAGDMVR